MILVPICCIQIKSSNNFEIYTLLNIFTMHIIGLLCTNKIFHIFAVAERATTPIRGPMRSWKNSSSKWQVCRPESFACGFKISAARTRRKSFKLKCKCNRKKYGPSKKAKVHWTNVICVVSLCRTDENLATGLCKVSRWWLVPRYAMTHRWTCTDLRYNPINHHGKHYQNLHCMRTLKLNLIRTLTVLHSSNWSIRFVRLRAANHSSSDNGTHTLQLDRCTDTICRPDHLGMVHCPKYWTIIIRIVRTRMLHIKTVMTVCRAAPKISPNPCIIS